MGRCRTKAGARRRRVGPVGDHADAEAAAADGSRDAYTGVQRARYPDGDDWQVMKIGQMEDGRVWRLQTF